MEQGIASTKEWCNSVLHPPTMVNSVRALCQDEGGNSTSAHKMSVYSLRGKMRTLPCKCTNCLMLDYE